MKGALTFLAAALKASLCEMSGLPALMRWISSLPFRSPRDKNQSNEKKGKGNVRSISIAAAAQTTTTAPLLVPSPMYHLLVSLTPLRLSPRTQRHGEKERGEEKERRKKAKEKQGLFALRLQKRFTCAQLCRPGPGLALTLHRGGMQICNGIAATPRTSTHSTS